MRLLDRILTWLAARAWAGRRLPPRVEPDEPDDGENVYPLW